MFSVMKSADTTTPYVNELVADTVADLDDIPVDSLSPGAICIVIETSSGYMLDHNKEWKLL